MSTRRRISSRTRRPSRRRRSSRVVGPARVLNLRDVAPNTAIDAARLAKSDPGGAEGEILLLSAAWDEKRDNTTAAFWKDAP